MKVKAFTLIELLIVVLIIAILAAIAVPNFLEFQTRAKVSRVHSDMRSLATAIVAYAVDAGEPAPGQDDFWRWEGLPLNEANKKAQVQLTTPIAYITTLPIDVFHEKTADTSDRKIFTYMRFDSQDNGDYLAAYETNYTWGLQTKGPSRLQPTSNYGMHNILARPDGILDVYDPTNGTVSRGVIIRSSKGIFSGLQGS